MRTRDGGRTWSELDWPSGAQSLAFVPGTARTLYLRVSDPSGATGGALFESEDEGESWVDTGAALPSADEVLVVPHEDGTAFFTWRGVELVRSTDGGSTWSAPELLSAPNVVYSKLGRTLVSSDANPTVYVEALAFTDRFESLVLVSTDGGRTFETRRAPGDEAPTLSLDCQGRLYTLAGVTLYRSDDAGRSWESLAELSSSARGLRVSSGVPAACGDVVYASAGDTLWRIDGTTVTASALPDYGEVVQLEEEGLLLVLTFGPRLRSDDGGRTWWTAGVDLGTGDLVSSPSALFVSTIRCLYRSSDGGRSWTAAPNHGPTRHDFYPDPHDADRLYARSIYGDDSPWSYVTMDRGSSFRDWPVPSAEAPEIPEALRATAVGQLTVVTRGGAYVTQDEGEHFTTLLTLPASQKVGWAAIGHGPTPPIYAYVFDDDAPTANRVVASLDGGASWTWSDSGTYITSLVVDPQDPRVAFALPGVSGEEGLVRTLDGGITWERLAVAGERWLTVHVDSQPPHAWYAAGQRLHRSDDHGATWHMIATLPPDRRALELDTSPGRARFVLGQRGLLYELVE